MYKFDMQTQNEFIDFTTPLCQRLQLTDQSRSSSGLARDEVYGTHR